jgi:hypothetical protein
MEILKLIASISTPIIVLIFGIIISRKIEDIKNESSIKRDWQIRWSESFYQTFQKFNTTVEELLVSLHKISELSKSGKGNNSPEIDNIINRMHVLTDDIQRNEFSLRTQLCYAPKSKNDILTLINNLFSILRVTLDTKKGNLDEIHQILSEINNKAKIAHKEILELSQ